MRTFIIRARKGTTRWDRIRSNVGSNEHFEIIAHSVMNAFFVSNGFREDVEFYLVLDSSEDFPRTIKLSAAEGLSIPGFHEEAILALVETALKNSVNLQKDQTQIIAPGLQISGFGFEKLVSHFLETRQVYLLDRKGEDIRSIKFESDPVFILSDHLALPKNSVKTLKRRGIKLLSFGKKMLFASQCIVLLNHELDRS
jgi:tRNA (pseudouridine54-N1)-methyltransferase